MSTGEVNRGGWQWTAKKEAAALALAKGAKWEAVQNEVGISSSTLTLWHRAPEFQARIDEHLQEITSEARRILQRGATAAAKKIVDLLPYGLPGHTTQLAAAKDILDRVGLSAKSRVEHSGAVLSMTPEDLAKLSDEELDELARKRGLL